MIIGIDLGTTYSVAAYMGNNGEISVVHDGTGEYAIPSVVLWDNGRFVVGNAAKDAASFESENVKSFIKDRMGEDTVIANWGGKEYDPVDLSAEIIKHMVENAKSCSGEEITGAVVTVPAYFTNAQRIATKKAVDMAGIEPISIINEPTAAALCYVHKNKISDEKILVYDLGGGTFDVSIIDVKDTNSIEVVSTQGLKKAGGHFFDEDVIKEIAKICKDEHGIDIFDEEYSDDLEELRGSIEKNKKLLAVYESARIPLRFGGFKGQYMFTRDFFESIVAKTYQRTEAKCKQAIKEAGLTIADIDRILLVGGSSRIPYIEKAIREFTGIEPMKDVNPEEAVAIGAAIKASDKKENADNKISFKDVCSHSIGISVIVNNEGDMENEIIIKKNSKIPCEETKRFAISTDGQEKVELSINEGEYKELMDVTCIANASFDLPYGAMKNQDAIVTLALDESQILHVYLSVPQLNYKEEYIKEKKKVIKQVVNRPIKVEPKKPVRVRYFDGVAERLNLNENGCPKEQRLDYILNELDNMVGLDSVKKEIRNQIDAKILEKMQRAAGLPLGGSSSMHMLFLGNSGTGKTTIARILGNIYYKMGALSSPEVIEVSRADLITPYRSEVPGHVREIVEKAVGKVLFIDEAYTLVHDKNDVCGLDIVETLLKYIEDYRDRMMVIMAGYDKEMEEFLSVNQGLSSRFNKRVYFEDYSVDDMYEIFCNIVHSNGRELQAGIEDVVRAMIEDKSRVPGFGNARGIRNLYESIMDKMNHRIVKKGANVSKNDLLIITREDIEAFAGDMGEIKSLDELIDDLNNLVGLKAAKEQVMRQISFANIEKISREKGIQRNNSSGSMHMLFLGNPGTGKTTVARMMGCIYKQLGLLPRGELTVEVSRAELVAEYLGQTATKVKQCVQRALGGVLFIDEAYSLYNGTHDTYGKEAVDTLLKCIEDNRDNLMVILAGYDRQMEEFLMTNPGLKSRFNAVIHFADYSTEELFDILRRSLKREGLVLEEGRDDDICKYLERMSQNESFSNGRGVRNIVERARVNQSFRLFQKGTDNISVDDLVLITYEDIVTE